MMQSQKPPIQEALIPLRQQIDILDEQLLQWLEKRVALIKQVGEIKQIYGEPALNKEREDAIIAKVTSEAAIKGIPQELVTKIWRAIFESAYILEEKENE